MPTMAPASRFLPADFDPARPIVLDDDHPAVAQRLGANGEPARASVGIGVLDRVGQELVDDQADG
jgi:hypothetical protein